MSFEKNANNTWRLKMPLIGLIAAFDKQNNAHLLTEGILEIDYLDGSIYDSDGDDKRLLVKIENDSISFETFSSDYSFWEGTENCKKQGCLGYVEDLIQELNHYDFEYSIIINGNHDYSEIFFWKTNYVKENYSELFIK